MNKQQSGSVVTFVIVGVLLAILVVGGIVVSQRRAAEHGRVADSAQNEREEIGEPTDSPEEENTSDEDAASDEAAEEVAENEAAEREQAAQDEAEAETERQRIAEETAERERAEQAEAARVAAEQQRVAANTEGTMPTTGGGTEVTPHAGSLPETGPVEDILMMTVGLIAIVGAGYVYYHYGYGRK